jgi:hypothetical protein
MNRLVITIPEKPPFYSLFADGPYLHKSFSKAINATRLAYRENEVLVLYYTYPTHREACVIRNTQEGVRLPGLSKRVTVLFSVHASRVDKLRRAAGFIKKHASLAFPDSFYIRLYFIILQRGKLKYPALKHLIDQTLSKEHTHDYPD